MIEVKQWKSIWNGKKLDKLDLDRSEFEIFCDLKRADGFDVNVGNETAYYTAFYDAWKEMYHKLMDFTGNEIHGVYEVGCGSGVNLYLFQNRLGHHARFGGIDYSTSLIEIAKKLIKSDDLICDEAINIDESTSYDLVMADSVFQYFDELDYAETVLRKMLSKTNKVIYLGELHDEQLKEDWLAHRHAAMKNYDEIYAGLPKMFYNREWLRKIAEEYHKKVCFTTLENKEYWNSKYLFYCYMY